MNGGRHDVIAQAHLAPVGVQAVDFRQGDDPIKLRPHIFVY